MHRDVAIVVRLERLAKAWIAHRAREAFGVDPREGDHSVRAPTHISGGGVMQENVAVVREDALDRVDWILGQSNRSVLIVSYTRQTWIGLTPRGQKRNRSSTLGSE
jgi:hypothetical protein